MGSDEGYELYRLMKASWHSHSLGELIYTDYLWLESLLLLWTHDSSLNK